MIRNKFFIGQEVFIVILNRDFGDETAEKRVIQKIEQLPDQTELSYSFSNNTDDWAFENDIFLSEQEALETYLDRENEHWASVDKEQRTNQGG